jgi:hypothetical protein
MTGGSYARLSKLPDHAGAESGSAAPTCGKPPAFRPIPHPSSSSAQVGRLSLPACAEEVVQARRPSERPSLSANQAAEPQLVGNGNERNLDKLGSQGMEFQTTSLPRAGQSRVKSFKNVTRGQVVAPSKM